MTKRRASASWAAAFRRNVVTLTRMNLRAGSRSLGRSLAPLLAQRKAPVGAGDWMAGLVLEPTSAQRYRVFHPAGMKFGERLPLMAGRGV